MVLAAFLGCPAPGSGFRSDPVLPPLVMPLSSVSSEKPGKLSGVTGLLELVEVLGTALKYEPQSSPCRHSHH